MKRKKYHTPQMDVVFIHPATPLLAGSVMGPGNDNETPGARIFDDDLDFFDDDDDLSQFDSGW